MADKEIEQVVEDDDLLEASKTEDTDEQLDEFKADNTGGDVIKGAEVPEPTGKTFKVDPATGKLTYKYPVALDETGE